MNFYEIWGNWKEGPSVLGSVVEFLKDKSVGVLSDTEQKKFLLAVPLPSFTDQISGNKVSFIDIIPSQYRDSFAKTIGGLLESRKADFNKALTNFVTLTSEDADAFNILLQGYEKHRRDCKAPDELWRLASMYFGLTDVVKNNHSLN